MKNLIIKVIFLSCFVSSSFLVFGQCPVGETEVTISFPDLGDWPSEISFTIDPEPPGGPVSGGSAGATFCAADGITYSVLGEDSFGDGWNGADIQVDITEDGSVNGCSGAQDGCTVAIVEDAFVDGAGPTVVAEITTGGSLVTDDAGCALTDIMGCTTPTACNYDPCATVDDGSCVNEGDSCDDGLACTENDMIQEDCSCAGTPMEGTTVDCEGNCTEVIADLGGVSQACPGTSIDISLDDVYPKGGDGINIFVISDNIDGQGTSGTLAVHDVWSLDDDPVDVPLDFTNPTCEIITVNLSYEVTCWPDANDPENVILSGEIGQMDVFPEPFTVVITAPDCGGNDGVAELTSADGTVCETIVLAAGMVACGGDVDTDESYDFGTLFAGTICEQGPFMGTGSTDCELCDCPAGVDYTDPMEVACGSAVPTLPAIEDLIDVPASAFGVAIEWTPDPDAVVEPMGCEEEVVEYTFNLTCLLDDTDITPAQNTHTLTVYPTLTASLTPPLCDGSTSGLYEVLAPDGSVCDFVAGTAGSVDETCSGGSTPAELTYGPMTFFAGTACEVIFEEDYLATCDPTGACGSTCLEIDIAEVATEACSGEDFTFSVGIVNDGADVNILIYDNLGNAWGPFNEWDFATDVAVAPFPIAYENETCEAFDVTFSYEISCFFGGDLIFADELGTTTISPAQPEANIANAETQACSGQADVITIELLAGNEDMCQEVNVPASVNMTCASVDASVSYLYDAAAIATSLGGAASCYSDITGSEDMTIFPAQPTAVVTDNVMNACSEDEEVITVELRGVDGCVLDTKTYDAPANEGCEVSAEEVAYEWTVAELETLTGAPAALACYTAVTGTATVNIAPAEPTAVVSNNVMNACSGATNVITVELRAADGTVCDTKMYDASANNTCAVVSESIAYGWTLTELQTITGTTTDCYEAITGSANVNVAPAQPSAVVTNNVAAACSAAEDVITVELRAVDGSVCATKMYDATANNTCEVATQSIAYSWTAAEITTLTGAVASCYADVTGTSDVDISPAQPTAVVTNNVGTACSGAEDVITVELRAADGTVCATKMYDASANNTCAVVTEAVAYSWTAGELLTITGSTVACYSAVTGTADVNVSPAQPTAVVVGNAMNACSEAANVIAVELRAANGSVCATKMYPAPANHTCAVVAADIDYSWTAAEIETITGSSESCYSDVSGTEQVNVTPAQLIAVVTENEEESCSEASEVITVELRSVDGSVCDTKTYDAPVNNTCDVVNENVAYAWTLTELETITGSTIGCMAAVSGSAMVAVSPAQPSIVIVSSEDASCDGSEGSVEYRIMAADGVSICHEGSIDIDANMTCTPAETAVMAEMSAAELAGILNGLEECYEDVSETEVVAQPVLAQAPVINKTEACIPGTFGLCSYEIVSACGNDELDFDAAAVQMEASGFEGATFNVEVTTEDGCVEIFEVSKAACDCNISLEYNTDLSDPCACNDDQSANGAQDGTFSETVTFTGTCGLDIFVGAGSTPASLEGLAFTSVLNANGVDCDYSITFDHVDQVGYYIFLVNGAGLPVVDSDSGEAYEIGNVCAYPVITEPDLADLCEDDPVVMDLAALSPELSAYPGTYSVSIASNGGAGVATPDFDPAALGIGYHDVTWSYTGDFFSNQGGTDLNPAFPGCSTDYTERVYINPVPEVLNAPESVMICAGSEASFDLSVRLEAADHLTPARSPLTYEVEAFIGGVWTVVYTDYTDAGGVATETIDKTITVPSTSGSLSCTDIRISVTAFHDVGSRCTAVSESTPIIVHDEGLIACNDTISFSINTDCTAETRIEMFLESEPEEVCGEYVPDYLSTFYNAVVTNADGDPVSDDELVDYLGQCLSFEVTDLCSENSCWGTVCIEDKITPVIENCEDLDMSLRCFELDHVLNSKWYTHPTKGILPYPEVTDCGDDYTISYVDDFEYTNLEDPKCGEIIVTRTWISSENTTAGHVIADTCVATYTLGGFTLGDVIHPEAVISLSCGQSAHPDSIQHYFDHPSTDDIELGENAAGMECDLMALENNEGVVYAYPHYYVLGCDGELHPQAVNNNVCNIFTSYADLEFEACSDCPEADHKKIERTWTYLDWCTGEIEEFTQLIKQVDDVPPVIERPDYSMSVDPWTCLGKFILLDPEHLYDECTHYADYTVTGPGSIISVNGDGSAPFEVSGLPKGENTFYYHGFDCCGNTSVDTVIISVEDNVPPTPIVLQDLVVSLTTTNTEEGIAKVYAEEFDNGSHDGNCGPVRFEVRRSSGGSCLNEGVDGYNNNITFNDDIHQFDNESDTDGGEWVTFCCEDLDEIDENGIAYGIHKVWLRVFDSGTDMVFNTEDDNYNESWINVRVEDKLFANVICPPDVTICCGWDPDDQSHTGVPYNNSVCHDYELEVRYDLPLGNFDEFCNEGTIQRTYDVVIERDSLTGEVTKWGEHGCTQLIEVEWSSCWDPTRPGGPLYDGTWEANDCDDPNEEYCGGEIDWPEDETLICQDFELNVPTWVGGPCDRIAYHVDQDTFWFEEGACFKLLNHWTVLNECVEERYPGYGTWTHTQVVKFFDDEDPILSGVDTCYAAPIECAGTPTLTNVACDTLGECMSEWIKWEVLIDLWGDWTIDYRFSTDSDRFDPNYGTPQNELYIPATNSCAPVFVTLPEEIPVSNYEHRVVWRASDGCGNTATQTTYFTVEDKKAPTPYCLNVSTALMDNGELDLWACDFDLGSFDDCTPDEDLQYTFSEVPPADDPDFNEDLQCSARTFTCQDIPSGIDHGSPILLEIYVWDNNGNSDFCLVELDLIDNSEDSMCDEDENSRIGGNIFTEAGTPVNDVAITVEALLPEYPISASSDENGAYDTNMHAHGNNYTVFANKDINYLNGVSTVDIVLIQRHILGLEDLNSPYKMIASDVNEDEKITTFDLLEIRKLILGIHDEFPETDSWQFIDESQALATESPWNYNEVIQVFDLDAERMNEDFVAVKMGDVNNSVIANVGDEAETRSGQILSVILPEVQLSAGDVVDIPLTFDSQEDWFGFQFTMELVGLEFMGVANENGLLRDENIARVESDILTVSWNSITPENISDQSMDLQFRVTEDISIDEAIQLSSMITKAEAYNQYLQVADIQLSSYDSEIILFQNEPNPFVDNTNIRFSLPEENTVRLTIYDVQGKQLYNSSAYYGKGQHTVSISSEILTGPGMYYYQIDVADFSQSQKMILIN